MRELIVGILLGIVATDFPKSAWGSWMDNNPNATVAIALAMILLIAMSRPILNLIDRKYPKFVRRFYEFFAPPIIDAEHERREQAQGSSKKPPIDTHDNISR